MGEVYRATDTRLGREVAIKVLPVTAAASPDALARFEREGRAIASLNHSNICTLFDVGTDEGHPCLVMELLSGASLHEVLEAGPLPVGALIDHAIELADALHAALGRGPARGPEAAEAPRASGRYRPVERFAPGSRCAAAFEFRRGAGGRPGAPTSGCDRHRRGRGARRGGDRLVGRWPARGPAAACP